MAKKDCKNVVFQAEIFYSPVEGEEDCLPITLPGHCCGEEEECPPEFCLDQGCCNGVNNPRNWRVRLIDGPKQVTTVGLHVVHVFATEDVPIACLDWSVYRNTDCGGCCTPEFYEVPVPWQGSGMMIPSGEYVFDLQEQMMPGLELPNDPEDTIEFDIELLFEPVGEELLLAIQYNAARPYCDCLGVSR